MNTSGRFVFASRIADRVAIAIVASWITASVLWTELGGFPHLYGWPFLVLRPEGGYAPPHLWVWVVDLAAACAAITATWCVAAWCCRARMKGFQFRLATLFGVVATIAVIAAVWRWSADHLGDELIPLGDQGEDGIGPSALLTPTAFIVWMPLLIRPMQLVVRLGVVSGLGCAIYVAGRFVAIFVRSLCRPTHS